MRTLMIGTVIVAFLIIESTVAVAQSDKDPHKWVVEAREALGKDPVRQRGHAEKLLRRAVAAGRSSGLSLEDTADATVLLSLILLGNGEAASEVRSLAEEAIRLYESTAPVNLSRLALALEILPTSCSRSGDKATADIARERAVAMRGRIIEIKGAKDSMPHASDVTKVSAAAKAPAVLKNPEPLYSAEALIAKWQGGAVGLDAVIDTKGRARNIRLARSVGFGLDEAAYEALKNWIFRPAMSNNDIPMAVSAHVEVNFPSRP